MLPGNDELSIRMAAKRYTYIGPVLTADDVARLTAERDAARAEGERVGLERAAAWFDREAQAYTAIVMTSREIYEGFAAALRALAPGGGQGGA